MYIDEGRNKHIQINQIKSNENRNHLWKSIMNWHSMAQMESLVALTVTQTVAFVSPNCFQR